MNLNFGTAFKAQITDPERQRALINGGRVDHNPLNPNYFAGAAANVYAVGDSAIINQFWNGDAGPNNLFRVGAAGIDN